MVNEIEKLIEACREEIKENESIWGEDMEDFNPMDASGGNFDDCYYMGLEHGRTEGELYAFRKVLKMVQEQSDRLSEAEDLLSEARDTLDSMHGYNSEVYRDIGQFLWGEDED